jgi:hypothetical protein
MRKSRFLIIFSVAFALFIFTINVTKAQAPFTLSVEPKTTTKKPGDMMTYKITIDADSGFNEPISLDLFVTALTYEQYYALNTQEPPYPKVYEYTFMVPEEVPADVTAHGVITGYGGGYVVEEAVTLKISSGGILGSIIGWVLGILNAIRNIISNLFN